MLTAAVACLPLLTIVLGIFDDMSFRGALYTCSVRLQVGERLKETANQFNHHELFREEILVGLLALLPLVGIYLMRHT